MKKIMPHPIGLLLKAYLAFALIKVALKKAKEMKDTKHPETARPAVHK